MHQSQQKFISLADIVFHHYSASVTALWFVTKRCSCCCFCDPSYPLSDNTHIHGSFSVHSEQMFMNASQSLTFSH